MPHTSTAGRQVAVVVPARNETDRVAATVRAAGMTTGAEAVALADQEQPRSAPRDLLFLDADLGRSAAAAAVLLDEARPADVVIGLLPVGPAGSGFGLVVRLSRSGIRRATGWSPEQPLPGQRLVRREAFASLLPLLPASASRRR